MGYYCTVPQCTSLAGKTKNVKFHRFPRDTTMADKWNGILKRGKPYTKYSKVCSLHFTQSDYNITTMGQWKTLSKDALPSQNLPKLHPDGTVMVIRKSRSVKYKDTVIVKKEGELSNSDKVSAWPVAVSTPAPAAPHIPASEDDSYQPPSTTLTPIIDSHCSPGKPKKQDAIMQTDPLTHKDPVLEEQHNTSADDRSFSSDSMEYSYVSEQIEKQNYQPKDYSKQPDDYVPQTNEEYNSEAEKYALERKPNFEKNISDYQKPIIDYQKSTLVNGYSGQNDFNVDLVNKGFERSDMFGYQTGFGADLARNNPHAVSAVPAHAQLRPDGHAFFADHIKQEIDLSNDEEKYLYSRNKQSGIESGQYYEAQVKTEPEPLAVCDTSGPQPPYYHHAPPNINPGMYYGSSTDLTRPGPELLIAKQNALAAHTQLWQNSMKRPFFYTDSTHYNTPMLHPRYEFQDLTRILNQ